MRIERVTFIFHIERSKYVLAFKNLYQNEQFWRMRISIQRKNLRERHDLLQENVI